MHTTGNKFGTGDLKKSVFLMFLMLTKTAFILCKIQ